MHEANFQLMFLINFSLRTELLWKTNFLKEIKHFNISILSFELSLSYLFRIPMFFFLLHFWLETLCLLLITLSCIFLILHSFCLKHQKRNSKKHLGKGYQKRIQRISNSNYAIRNMVVYYIVAHNTFKIYLFQKSVAKERFKKKRPH